MVRDKSRGQIKIVVAKNKKRVCPIMMTDKTQEELIKEFEDAFKVNDNFQDMPILFVKENLGAKPIKPSPDRRDAQQHCKILSRVIDVMETDQMTANTNDDPLAIGAGLKNIYGVANAAVKREDARKSTGSRLEDIFGDDFDISKTSERKPSENTSNALIIVNAKGEIISKPEWGRRKLNPNKES